MRGASAVVLIAALASLPACSDGAQEVTATPELPPADDRLVSCGGEPYPARALRGPTGAEAADTPPAAALRRMIAGGNFEDVPDTGWRVLVDRPDLVVFGAGEPNEGDGDGWLTEVRVSDDGDGFDIDGSSHWCRPKLHLPGSLVSFSIAPDTVLQRGTRSLDVVVSQRGCTGGAPVVDRLRPPAVRYGPDRVEVLFTADPLPRAIYTCIGLPPEPATLRLDEPLGDRLVLDASNWPPSDATTPLP